MKLSGEAELNAPRQQVWEALLDPGTLEKTLPGCDKLVPIGENEYQMKMKVAMASVSGLFDGKVKLADQQPMDSYSLDLSGQGKIGFLKGSGRFDLQEVAADKTKVRYSGDVQVGGMIASVGQRLMDMTAKMMIKNFFSSLDKELQTRR